MVVKRLLKKSGLHVDTEILCELISTLRFTNVVYLPVCSLSVHHYLQRSPQITVNKDFCGPYAYALPLYIMR